MKVGVILMALALAFLIAAVVVSLALRSEPERLVAAEVATNSPGEASPNSSGQKGSATKNSSSQKEFPLSSSGEKKKSLRYGSSSSTGWPLERSKEEAKEGQAQQALPQNSQAPTPQLADNQTPSEAPSWPQSQPQQQQQHEPQHQERPLAGAEQSGWQNPTQGELESAKGERHYELLPGAIGIYDAPVFDSDGRWALANGIAHNPQTSLPWSPTLQRNVYLAGHRMGYRGTWSRMR